jgi:hypothetical protein
VGGRKEGASTQKHKLFPASPTRKEGRKEKKGAGEEKETGMGKK